MTHIFKDKVALLKRFTEMDENMTVDEVAVAEKISIVGVVADSDKSINETSNHTFLLHVLLEALCRMWEDNEESRQHLFNGVYTFLAKSNNLDEQIVLNDLMHLRRKMAFNLLQIVDEIRHTISPSPVQDIRYLDSMNNLLLSKDQNKYKETFEEIEVIAKGGFGTVCRAKHKFDGMIYAVKKIIFKYRNDSDYTKVIREVKSIATLSHLNVVSYNSAWIEEMPTHKELPLDVSFDTQSEESQLESFNNFLFSGKRSKGIGSIKSSSLKSNRTSFWSRSSNSKQTDYSEEIPNLKEPNGKQKLLNTILKKDQFRYLSEVSEQTERSSIYSELSSSYENHSEMSRGRTELRERSESLLSSADLASKNMNLKVMLCIQMEYCDCDLRFWLDQRARGEPLPFQMGEIDIFKDILSGVAHIHSKSIIHRDLKPQNIFFSAKDNVMKIGDFGLATLGGPSPNGQKEFSCHYSSNLGTLPYAAPEQRNRNNYNNKVDIYSLGIILIELLLQFQTQMEFCKTIDSITHGNPPAELIAHWSNYVSLVENLVQNNPNLRMPAKKILRLPLIQGKKDNQEVDKCQMSIEIKDLKRKLLEKDRLIKELRQKIEEQACIIAQHR